MTTTQTTVDSAPYGATFDGAEVEAFRGRMSPFP